MAQRNDPSLVHKALAKAQSVEARLNALVPQITPQMPVVVYNQNTTVVTQSAAGSYTWVCPAGITSVMVECWGAGAGGGGGGPSQGGEGGGGGAYAAEPAYAVTPGTSYTYVVGSGGTGGLTGNVGASGTGSYFDPTGGSGYGVFAGGGLAGSGFTGGAGAAVSSGTTVVWAGGNGSGDGGQSTGGCGGGSSASPVANGNDGAGDSGGTTGTAGGAGGTDKGAGGAGGNNTLSGVSGSTPGGGGGGCGAASAVSQVTLTYGPTSSVTYYGSDATGGNANKQRAATVLYQGGQTSSGGTYNGTMKSLMILPSSVASDLVGVTIDSVGIKLKNQHTYYSSGMTVLLGYTSHTSLPSTWTGSGATHTSSYHVDEFSYGAGNGVDVTGDGLGTAMKSGAAKALYIGLGGAYLASEYGYFSPAGASQPPLVTIVGHTAGANVQAGSGAAGQVRLTYQAPTSIIAAVQPVAGTDQYGNPYVAGLSGQNLQLYGNVTPATPPAGSSILYTTGGGSPTVVNSTGLNGQIPATRGNIQSFTCNSGASTAVTAAWSIPANDANVGTVYRVRAFGVGTYTSGNTNWWECQVFGSGQAKAQYPSFPATFLWEADAEVSVVTTGSSGTAFVKLSVLVSGNQAQANPSVIIGMTGGTGGTVVTVNTTSATTMSLICAVNGTCSITGITSTFERLGA
jgi:hypothetical protein